MTHASNENFSAYLGRVKNYFPHGFEEGLKDEGLATGATAFIFVSFMRDGEAKQCADELVRMNSIEAN